MQRPFLLALLAMFFSRLGSARAWNYSEHLSLGQEGYTSACTLLASSLATVSLPSNDPRLHRLTLACGTAPPSGNAPKNKWESPRSFVYGQAVAISGDLLSSPEEFFSALGGEHVLSTGYYFSLALVNSSHFHPQSFRNWRQFHVLAINEAVLAASSSVVDQEQKFEHAFYMSAFAQHFLQDSFAAGHMGFNRPASGAAASFRYHQRWNKEGRLVRNDRGNIWTAYGDAKLATKENNRNRQFVLEAAMDAAVGFLSAFVNGSTSSDGLDGAVSTIIPSGLYSYDARGPSWIPDLVLDLFSLEAPEFNAFRKSVETTTGTPSDLDERRSALGRVPGKNGHSPDELYLRSTTSLHNRSFKDWGVNVSWICGGRRFSEAGCWQAILPELNMRLLTDALRVYVGFGYVYKPSNSAGGGFGLKYQLGTSVHGLVTHELSFGNWARYTCFGCSTGFRQVLAPRNSLFGFGYKVSGEMGPVILGIEVAPALVFDDYRASLGYYTGATLEFLFSAAGGGPL